MCRYTVIIQHNNVQIYFGDKSDGLTTTFYLNLHTPNLLDVTPFNALKKTLPIQDVMFAEQVHGINGLAVDGSIVTQIPAFGIKADYLITNTPGLGIGVMSADCLPIIVVDKKNNAVAAIHSGWRGSVDAITSKALAHMQTAYNTQLADVTIIFGPAAGACCYEIQEDFLTHIGTELVPYCIRKRNHQLFFDNTAYTIQFLTTMGLQSHQLITQYNECTMCNPTYCSYRRDKNTNRQMSVVCII